MCALSLHEALYSTLDGLLLCLVMGSLLQPSLQFGRFFPTTLFSRLLIASCSDLEAVAATRDIKSIKPSEMRSVMAELCITGETRMDCSHSLRPNLCSNIVLEALQYHI